METLSLPISAFCKTGSGTTPSRNKYDRYFGGDIPWVKSGELRESVITNTEETVTQEALAETSLKIAPKGAILVAMYGANVGRLGILGIEATTNQAVCHIVPDSNKADSKYLFRILQQKLPEFISRSVGGAQPNISQQIIRETEIPLPPIAEQKRIAAILDKAEELRGLRRKALGELDAIAQSIFLEMFGDPVTNPKKWASTTSLGEIADITSGITKGRKLGEKIARIVPYLAVVNVQDKALNLSILKTIEASADEINRYLLRKDDLLLTEGGDPDKLGRGTLWGGEIAECIHQNHVYRVRLTSGCIHPLFLNWLVGSQRGKKYFLRAAKQTTGIATINMTQLRGFPVLLPPISLQQEFAQRVEAIERLKATHRESLAQLDALFSSLQHRAFRGEL